MKSLEIAKHIYELASAAGMKQVLLIGNKVANETQEDTIRKFAEANDMTVLGFVPFDPQVMDAEMNGDTPLNRKESRAIRAIGKLCDRLTAKNA